MEYEPPKFYFNASHVETSTVKWSYNTLWNKILWTLQKLMGASENILSFTHFNNIILQTMSSEQNILV